jgi:hypothetical protein
MTKRGQNPDRISQVKGFGFAFDGEIPNLWGHHP